MTQTSCLTDQLYIMIGHKLDFSNHKLSICKQCSPHIPSAVYAACERSQYEKNVDEYKYSRSR